MTEITLEITKYCENGCSFCSTDASVRGEHLPYDTIFKFLDKEHNNKDIDRINISGGEPLSHPDFYKILRLCKELTDNVWVYTNALDKIIVNSRVVKKVTVHSNVCVVPGEIYIPGPDEVDQVHLLKLVKQGRAKDYPDLNISVSRNFYDPQHCDKCNHIYLQANGEVVTGPCKKTY